MRVVDGECEQKLAAQSPADRPLIDLGLEDPSIGDDYGHAGLTALIGAIA